MRTTSERTSARTTVPFLFFGGPVVAAIGCAIVLRSWPGTETLEGNRLFDVPASTEETGSTGGTIVGADEAELA